MGKTSELLDGRNVGETNFPDQTITVRLMGNPYATRETLFHELLHVAMGHSGIRGSLSFRQEERIVAALEPSMLMILRDNAWLREYLFGDDYADE